MRVNYQSAIKHRQATLDKLRKHLKDRESNEAPSIQEIIGKHPSKKVFVESLEQFKALQLGYLNSKLEGLEEQKYFLEKARKVQEKLGVSGKEERRISHPVNFEKFLDRTNREFYKFFLRKGVKLPYFDSEEGLVKPPKRPSTRAIGAILGQLAKGEKNPPFKNFPQALVNLLKKNKIRRVLEIGPGGRGVVDLLAESGLAKEAGIELSAIDLSLSLSRVNELNKKGIKARVGNVTNLGNIETGKFDLIIAVGVLGAGGQYGATKKPNAITYSINSHKVARSAVDLLSPNPNAFFCAVPIFGATTLRLNAVQRFAKVSQWQPTKAEQANNARGAFLPSSNRNSQDDWYKTKTRNEKILDSNKYYRYTNNLLGQLPSVAILKRK